MSRLADHGNRLHTFGLFVPLAALAGWLVDLWAVFAVAAVANLVLGVSAYVIAQRHLTETVA